MPKYFIIEKFPNYGITHVMCKIDRHYLHLPLAPPLVHLLPVYFSPSVGTTLSLTYSL